MININVKNILQVIGLLVFIAFLATIDFAIVPTIISKLNIFWIFCFSFLWILGLVVKGYIWKFLLKKLNIVNISFSYSVMSIIVGVSSGALLPGKVDMARPLILKSTCDIEYKKSIAALLIERFMFFSSLIFCFIISIVLVFGDLELTYLNFLPLIVLVFLFITFLFNIYYFLEKLENLILKFPLPSKFYEEIKMFFEEFKLSISKIKENKTWGFISLLFLFSWYIEILRFYFILQFVGIFLDYHILSFSYFASNLLSLTIPGGIGIFEYSQLKIVSSMSQDVSKIGLTILIYRVIFYYSTVLLGAIMLFFSDRIFYKLKV